MAPEGERAAAARSSRRNARGEAPAAVAPAASGRAEIGRETCARQKRAVVGRLERFPYTVIYREVRLPSDVDCGLELLISAHQVLFRLIAEPRPQIVGPLHLGFQFQGLGMPAELPANAWRVRTIVRVCSKDAGIKVKARLGRAGQS